MTIRTIILLFSFVLGGCHEQESTLFVIVPSEHSGISFSNQLNEGREKNILNYVYYYNGGGVGIGDFNNDGLEDIFLSGNEVSSQLYLNKGELKFEEKTSEAGVQTKVWCTGVAIVDINNDGWDDIYVSVAGEFDVSKRKNLLFVNQAIDGKAIFKEMATSYGIDDAGFSTQAAFFDFDLDGDLDLYVLNHDNDRTALNTPLPRKKDGTGKSNDHLYLNEGNGHFSDISTIAGINIEGYGLGISISDFNDDGWPDIYVSNDFIYNDLLYINQEGKYFKNEIATYLDYQTYNGMGCDIADLNQDGKSDILVMDMLPETDEGQKMMIGAMTWDKWQLIKKAGYEDQYMRNTLQISNGNVFSEVAQMAGLDKTDWSWAPLIADFDLDGLNDVFISNGYLRDITDKDFIDYSNHLVAFRNQDAADSVLLPEIKELPGKMVSNRFFKNDGNLSFKNMEGIWSEAPNSYSNGAAYADFDLDGDLDLICNNLNGQVLLYKNNASENGNQYLNIRLKGPENNQAAYGSTVTIKSKNRILSRYLQPTRGFMSSTSKILNFGFDSLDQPEQLIVGWPDGNEQVVTITGLDRLLEINYDINQFSKPVTTHNKVDNPVFTAVDSNLGIHFQHQEKLFNDFRHQPLILHGFSKLGPALVEGDLNGDGLEDLFIGGATGQKSAIFFQNRQSTFSKYELEDSEAFEDVDAVIFDMNGDQKQDLIVLSSSQELGPKENCIRLYLQEKGKLIRNDNLLPELNGPFSCLAASDFDLDGDMDLYVGGSAIFGQYPLAAKSNLLENKAGKLQETENSFFENNHLISTASWKDLDGDNYPELILAGEWMPVSIFKNKNGSFQNVTENYGLENTCGWWRCMEWADINNDGRTDLLAGNFGWNSKLEASESNPLTLYFDDFDKNGSLESILCRNINGKEKPIHERDEMMSQVNRLEQKYPRYLPYSKAGIEDIFGKERLEKAKKLSCNTLSNTVFLNTKDGFKAQELPIESQVSCINAFLSIENTPFTLMAGNSRENHLGIGEMLALKGALLYFENNNLIVSHSTMGIDLSGVTRNMIVLNLHDGKKLLAVGTNNGPVSCYYINDVPVL